MEYALPAGVPEGSGVGVTDGWPEGPVGVTVGVPLGNGVELTKSQKGAMQHGSLGSCTITQRSSGTWGSTGHLKTTESRKGALKSKLAQLYITNTRCASLKAFVFTIHLKTYKLLICHACTHTCTYCFPLNSIPLYSHVHTPLPLRVTALNVKSSSFSSSSVFTAWGSPLMVRLLHMWHNWRWNNMTDVKDAYKHDRYERTWLYSLH